MANQIDFPMSAAQEAFITKLMNERSIGSDLEHVIIDRGANLTKRQASQVIDLLMKSPVKVVAGRTPITVPGMYGKQGLGVFRVKIAKTSGKPYAMRLVVVEGADKVRFEYEAGAIRQLAAEDKWSLEQAKAFGLETGFCCVCGAFLTDPKSVEAGIGPVCAKKV